MWFERVKRNVQCSLCPHACVIHEGNSGNCMVRQNRGGKIRNVTYGLVSGFAVDPIEKKPLYHFNPGHSILSVGSVGCNLKCNFCQNWKISQAYSLSDFTGKEMTPEQVCNEAQRVKNNLGVAYTYNEPTVWYEFMFDIAVLVKKAGMQNVMVSNGFIQQKPLENLLGVIDAFNIDLKAFTDNFYREMTGGFLAPVLETLKRIRVSGKHLEITNLIISRKNDDEDKFEEMIYWIFNELGPNTVLHLSRYFPRYKQSSPATSEDKLMSLYRIAKSKLKYVYLGNVSMPECNSTLCPECGTVTIQRNGYQTKVLALDEYGNCTNCNTHLVEIRHNGI